MIRITHLTPPLVVASASAALLVAGCGGKSPSSPSVAGPGQNIAASAYKFSRCMRQHGVPGFPDPKVINQPGHQGVDIHVTPALTSSPSFNTAQKACAGIMPGSGGGNNGPSPQEVAARVKGLRSFATCMRSHRVSSFPDPTTHGQITPAMISAAGLNFHAPAFAAAARACVPASDGQLTAAQVAQATGPGSGGASSGSSSGG